MKKIRREDLVGVWSAAPTPLTGKLEVDEPSARRMVEHHVRLGVKGLFLLGTNGEGPWLSFGQRRQMVSAVVRAVRGRMLVAVQVTDNSVPRMRDNLAMAQAEGADIAVLAPPFFMMNATPQNLWQLYRDVIRGSPLPVGVYDRGSYGSVQIPIEVLARAYADPNVVLVKDSSSDMQHQKMALAVRRRRPSLALLNGNEFRCVEYLQAGYDGLLLGGGVFNGGIAGWILEACRAGDRARAERLQRRMNRIMWAVYGGKKIKCWLNGEKLLLVKMGLFRTNKTLLNYPVTPACRRAIHRVLVRDRDVLWPYKEFRRA